MQLSTVKETEPYLYSDDSDIYNGRTIVWKKIKVLAKEGGSFEKVTSGDLNKVPAPGAPCGLVGINVQCEDGVAEITWTFRAEWADGGSSGTEGSTKIYDLQGSTSQEPITSHPRYKEIYEKYAITERDGEPVWMEKDPDNKSGTTGLSSAGETVTNMSPLYGVKDYLAANAVYRLTKYYKGRGQIPALLIKKVGKIDTPEGLTDPGPAGRWLRSGVSMRQMGDAFQVTISWMASQSSKPEGLWKKEIYG